VRVGSSAPIFASVALPAACHADVSRERQRGGRGRFGGRRRRRRRFGGRGRGGRRAVAQPPSDQTQPGVGGVLATRRIWTASTAQCLAGGPGGGAVLHPRLPADAPGRGRGTRRHSRCRTGPCRGTGSGRPRGAWPRPGGADLRLGVVSHCLPAVPSGRGRGPAWWLRPRRRCAGPRGACRSLGSGAGGLAVFGFCLPAVGLDVGGVGDQGCGLHRIGGREDSRRRRSQRSREEGDQPRLHFCPAGLVSMTP
jgi:hypothetical protein